MKFVAICIFFIMSLCQGVFADLTPDQAWQILQQGNQRYVNDRLLHPDRTSERRDSLTVKQNPFAVIVGCSDSRVAPEILFDQGIGDLFVVRVAGNVVGPIELDSIEYSVGHLGSILVVVLGHENCGAVDAVLQGQDQDIPTVGALIQPAVNSCKKDPKPVLDKCVRTNVRNVVKQLNGSSVLSGKLNNGSLKVLGAYYSLQTGKVELVQ